MFRGTGAGGRLAPRTSSVYAHHEISAITITVVNCMIQSAFWLDSWMPFVFCHQKYSVAMIAKIVAVALAFNTIFRCMNENSSFSTPTRYLPAATPLIGP